MLVGFASLAAFLLVQICLFVYCFGQMKADIRNLREWLKSFSQACDSRMATNNHHTERLEDRVIALEKVRSKDGSQEVA